MKQPRLLLHIVLFVALLSGCAALPQSAPESTAAPVWIEELPAPTEEHRFFYGVGGDPEGNRQAAEIVAAEQIAEAIISSLGAEREDGSVDRRMYLTELRGELVAALTGEGSLEGVRVEERHVADGGGETGADRQELRVHLLAAVERGFLEAERRALTGDGGGGAEAGTLRAAIVPEEAAEDLESRGRYLEAAAKYIEAAASSIALNSENRERRFDRNISAAENILSEVRLEKLNDDLSTEVGTPFSQPFRAALTIGGRGIPEAELLVEYTVIEPNGRTGSETTTLTTDSEGIASFDHPVPRFVGTESLSMSLRPDPFLASLSSLSEAPEGAVDRITSTLAAKRVLFRYTVESATASIPTAVTLLATDIAGNPMESGALETGFRQRLEAEEFDLRRIDFQRRRLTELSPQALASALRAAAPAELQRVVYGVARIDEFNERDGVIVSVSGSASVVRLADGEIITTVEGVQHSRGSSSQSAIAAAFRGLGDKLAVELLRSLPSP